MTDEPVVRAVQEHVGGRLRKHPRDPNLPMWMWDVTYIKGVELLERLRPYLVLQRKQALADMLIHDPVVRSRQRGRGHSKQAHHDALYHKMWERNYERLSKVPRGARVTASESDAWYMAAILDGEGHIHAENRAIEVWSTDPELLAWIRARFGGNIHDGRPARGLCRRTWRWSCPPTGAVWIPSVASKMLVDRKRTELSQLANFQRTFPRPHYPDANEPEYVRLRLEEGVRRAPALRESGVSLTRARLLGF
jgi:hypothetical protein